MYCNSPNGLMIKKDMVNSRKNIGLLLIFLLANSVMTFAQINYRVYFEVYYKMHENINFQGEFRFDNDGSLNQRVRFETDKNKTLEENKLTLYDGILSIEQLPQQVSIYGGRNFIQPSPSFGQVSPLLVLGAYLPEKNAGLFQCYDENIPSENVITHVNFLCYSMDAKLSKKEDEISLSMDDGTRIEISGISKEANWATMRYAFVDPEEDLGFDPYDEWGGLDPDVDLDNLDPFINLNIGLTHTWKNVQGEIYLNENNNLEIFFNIPENEYWENGGKKLYITMSCLNSEEIPISVFDGSMIDPITNFLVYDIKHSMPKATAIPIPAKCKGEMGSIRIEFDRKLEDYEQLQLFWKDGNNTVIDSSFLYSENGKWHYLYESLSPGEGELIIAGWNGSQQITGATQKFQVEIKEPVALTYSTQSYKDIQCYGVNQGEIKINVSGGTPPYTLHYRKGSETEITKTQSSGSFTLDNLSGGIYTYYVIDANGCEYRDATGRIVNYVEISAPASALAINNFQTKNPSGYGLANGEISFEVSGGYGDYKVEYKSNGVPTEIEKQGSVYKIIEAVAGTYQLTVTDNNGGCTLTREVILSQPAPIVITISQTKAISCYNGSNAELSASVTGGIGGYKYSWFKKNGSNFESLFQNTSTLSNLISGTYKLTVTDSNDITAEQEFVVTQPNAVTISEKTSQNIFCYGENTGYIQFRISGGTGSYTVYYMQEGVDADFQTKSSSGSGSLFKLENLTAGVYKLYVKDSNDCDAPSISDVELTQPLEALAVSQSTVFSSGIGYSDGKVIVLLRGGSKPYSIEWKNSGNTTIPASNTTVGGEIKTEISNLATGTYTLTVKDANNCSITQVFYVEERALLQVSLLPENVKCYNTSTGKITARVTGGLPKEGAMPYDYVWYKIENASETLLTGETDSLLVNLPIGKYKVMVKDSLNDVASSSVVEITQPALLTTALTKRNIACFGESTGYIHVTVEGGTGLYMLYYKKTEESTYQNVSLSGSGNTFNVNNLSAGQYNLYIQDSNGCYAQIEGQDVVLVELSQPSAALAIKSTLLTEPSGYNLSNGKIEVAIEGGTPPYSIEWKDAQGNIITFSEQTQSGATITNLSGLSKGDYFLSVKDANYSAGTATCSLAESYTLNQPEELKVAFDLTSVLCHGFNTGQIDAHVTGGVKNNTGLPYLYQWYSVKNGAEVLLGNEKDSILSTIPAGKYKLLVTDGSYIPNKVQSPVLEITQPDTLTATVFTRNISCFNGNDGYIHIKVDGGVGGYKFFYRLNGVDTGYKPLAINTSDNTFYLDNLTEGSYNVYVQDQNNCYALINNQNIGTIELLQPEKALTIARKDSLNPTGYGREDGEMTVFIEGGTSPYHVVWKDAEGNTMSGEEKTAGNIISNTLFNQRKGVYQVVVRDANFDGSPASMNQTCMASESFVLEQPDSLMVSISMEHIVSCHGMSDGKISVQVIGGVPKQQGIPYLYKWFRDTGEGYLELEGRIEAVLENIPAGKYKVEVTDFSRTPNITTAEYILTQPELLIATATQEEIGCGQTTSVSVSVTGGTAPYSYLWDTGAFTTQINNVSAGNYLVMVRDANGCETGTWARVTNPADIIVEGSLKNPGCNGGSNGAIQLSVSGGKSPYTYQWDYNNSTTPDLTNIPAGTYVVTVRDQAGCSFRTSFELLQPPVLTVDLKEDRTLCNGQSLVVTPVVSESNVKYNWTGSNSFRSTDAQVTLDKEGLYKLTVTNPAGCTASDEINIKIQNVDISSEIVVSSQVFVNDTIVIVNISTPDPERQEWLFPESDSLKIVEQSEHFAKVIFYELGQYTIGMRSYMGDCFQEVLKNITVINADENRDDLFGESIIKEFVIAPNPNSGTFNVTVELNKVSSIRLRLVNIESGLTLHDRRLDGQELYQIPYNLVLSPGVYILLLETPSGRMVQRMIIAS